MTRTARDNTLPILLEYATSQLWLVHYPTLERMVSLAENHCNGVRLDAASIAGIVAARDQKAAETTAKVDALEVSGDTAVIHVDGVVAKYSRMVNGSSQPRGTSLETLNAQLDAALDDPAVKSIFLRIESPGGSGAGLADFADRVYEATTQKPVIAFADDIAASAAYWIGSQASRFYANQSAFVGSIGVYSVMVDSSAAAEKDGFKVHIIRSGANKGVGVPGTAITDENLAYVQGLIYESYEECLTSVMRGRGDRGLTEEKLRQLADGRVVKAAEAKATGLIDGIMTLSQAFNSARPNPRPSQTNPPAASAAAESFEQQKEQPMTDTITTQDQAADAGAATKAALAVDRKRISDITAAFSGVPALAEMMTAAIASETTLVEAKAAAYDIQQSAHAEAMAARDAELAEANKKIEAIASAGESDIKANDPPDAGQDSSTPTSDDGQASTYARVYAANVASGMKGSHGPRPPRTPATPASNSHG